MCVGGVHAFEKLSFMKSCFYEICDFLAILEGNFILSVGYEVMFTSIIACTCSLIMTLLVIACTLRTSHVHVLVVSLLHLYPVFYK